MVKVFESLLPIWEFQTELPAPVFSLAQPQAAAGIGE